MIPTIKTLLISISSHQLVDFCFCDSHPSKA